MRLEDLNVNKIYINTVAKVGSASFLHSLKAAGFDVHHGHSLAALKNTLDNEENCLIVSGIRNPLDRNLSYFFQTYSDKFFNDVKTAKNEYKGENCFVLEKDEINSISPIKIIDIFKIQKWHETFNDWFYEFLDITKIDFFEFDKKAGLSVYSLPNNNFLLFYVFEKLNVNTPFIEAFFGIKELTHANNSEERMYKNQYKIVKSLINFSETYKNSLLRTPIMNIFYEQKDIISFMEKY